MPDLERLYPRPGTVTAQVAVDDATSVAHGDIGAFDPRVIALLNDLSQELTKLSRAEPALAPLAFFMRRSATTQLGAATLGNLPAACRAMPQGVVFHIPPTNVDTLFLYTLSIALLAGNANIVRISENAGPATEEILELLFAALDRYPAIAPFVTVVRFSRDSEALAMLSSAADVRMIWGGDASITAIRHAALRPHAKDLTFPDRLSVAGIRASAWQEAEPEVRLDLATALYNDTYWFDQMACSSPQQLILIGEPAGCAEMLEDLLGHLDRIARDRYKLPGGQAINKMVAVVEAIARGSDSLSWNSNSSVAIGGLTLEDATDIRPGGGFFSTQTHADLIDFAPQITRRVQTFASFGFDPADLDAFAVALNGRGIDRMVPIGRALDFSEIWDGKNLVLEMLRLVSIN